ncbi:MAG: hypothetical protein DWQ04_07210 [Chloroflexi bacterium]|nr:MAG: hypothetical protein DWQ04_07210 [Chloroflexota bacterium]
MLDVSDVRLASGWKCAILQIVDDYGRCYYPHNMSFAETHSEKVERLRIQLEKVHQMLVNGEAELADQKADIQAFEFEFAAHVGQLLDQLAAVEVQVNQYLARIQQMRDETQFGEGYESVDRQFERSWRTSPQKEAVPPPTKPPTTPNEAQIKKLYRRLARAFHPDMAQDDADRAYRTEMMAAVNDAYAARSMAELMAIERELAGRKKSEDKLDPRDALSDVDMIAALQNEIKRCRRRLQEIELEMQTMHNQPMVALALEMKLAKQEGRNLLDEMVAELERKIARKSVELDMLRSQFTDLF